MEKTAVFLNPSAGKGRAIRKRENLENLLKKHKINYDLFITQSEENLKELTREKAGKYRILVGAGGDSTFNIMANEIVIGQEDTVLGMIGLGSSNDIAMEFDLHSMEKACAALKQGNTKRIDLGRLVHRGKTLRYYIGQANIGLGVSVNKYIAGKLQKNSKLGKIQILAGFLGMRNSYRQGKVPITLSISTQQKKIQGRFVLAVFNNTRFWATGKEINHHARPDDGKLDCFLIDECSLYRLAKLIFLSGKRKHLDAPEVRTLQAEEFIIKSETPFEIQTDGEILGGFQSPEKFNEIRIEVVPRTLKIISSKAK